jgi:hypothetical protein
VLRLVANSRVSTTIPAAPSIATTHEPALATGDPRT